jgi:antitoxin component of RelBE/YafQ-DinJ toxin-antitoxin module
MSDRALLSIRTDAKTKKDITVFAESLGLSVSAFATVVLKQAVSRGRVVLEPELEPTPYLKKAIRQADANLKAGRVSKPMNGEEALAHLRSLM